MDRIVEFLNSDADVHPIANFELSGNVEAKDIPDLMAEYTETEIKEGNEKQKEMRKSELIYGVQDNPPWHMDILFAIQVNEWNLSVSLRVNILQG